MRDGRYWRDVRIEEGVECGQERFFTSVVSLSVVMLTGSQGRMLSQREKEVKVKSVMQRRG